MAKINSKWQYHKELIYHLKMWHALPDDILFWIDVIANSVDIGIKQGNKPKRQAEIIKEVIEERSRNAR